MGMGVASSRRGRGRGNRRTPMADINVTPFVDVMLVLLIIFMVTAPLLTSGVPIDLPDSRAEALPQEREPITISVAPDGTVYLDDDLVTPAQLPTRLAAIRPADDGTMPQINLRGDRGLAYGEMMRVMGELNRAGLTSIALLTNSAAGGDAVAGDTAVSDSSDSGQ